MSNLPSIPTLPLHTHPLDAQSSLTIPVWNGVVSGETGPWDWLSPQQLPAKEEQPPQAGLGSALAATILPLPFGSGPRENPRALQGDSRQGKGGAELMSVVSQGQQPSPALQRGQERASFQTTRFTKASWPLGKGGPGVSDPSSFLLHQLPGTHRTSRGRVETAE